MNAQSSLVTPKPGVGGSLLTFEEAAAQLRVSVWTIRRLVRERALPVITLSPRVRRIAATDLPTTGAKL